MSRCGFRRYMRVGQLVRTIFEGTTDRSGEIALAQTRSLDLFIQIAEVVMWCSTVASMSSLPLNKCDLT
jgi:hypothetical protein